MDIIVQDFGVFSQTILKLKRYSACSSFSQDGMNSKMLLFLETLTNKIKLNV